MGIILDVDVDIALARCEDDYALSRKRDLPTRGYLEFRKSIYRKLGDVMNWKVLDGSKSVEKNVKRILEMIDYSSG